MKNSIINKDKNDNYHDVQISYWSNGNICWIENNHHGKCHGYKAWFNLYKSIGYKQYWNMDKRIYTEDHEWNKQIQIRI